jgi:hypothetical protein
MFHSNDRLLGILRDELKSGVSVRFRVEDVSRHDKPDEAGVEHSAGTQQEGAHLGREL